MANRSSDPRGGLVLEPSVFIWLDLYVKRWTASRTTISYPVRGVGVLWKRVPIALAQLLGERRAQLLVLWRAPHTTAELARRFQITASAVSQHLAPLRAAGLISSAPVWRERLHMTSALGLRLEQPARGKHHLPNNASPRVLATSMPCASSAPPARSGGACRRALLASDASVRFDNFAVPSGAQPVSEDVACPAGQRALGGGVSFGSPDAGDRVVFSEPRVGGAAPNAQSAVANGWGAAVLNGAGEERTATVWVVCTAR